MPALTPLRDGDGHTQDHGNMSHCFTFRTQKNNTTSLDMIVTGCAAVVERDSNNCRWLFTKNRGFFMSKSERSCSEKMKFVIFIVTEVKTTKEVFI